MPTRGGKAGRGKVAAAAEAEEAAAAAAAATEAAAVASDAAKCPGPFARARSWAFGREPGFLEISMRRAESPRHSL